MQLLKRIVFFILNDVMQPLEYVCAVGYFFTFLRYFSAPKFASNGNLQNDKESKLSITCRKQKILFFNLNHMIPSFHLLNLGGIKFVPDKIVNFSFSKVLKYEHYNNHPQCCCFLHLSCFE